MKVPGFTAEAALGAPSRTYRSPRRSAAGAGIVPSQAAGAEALPEAEGVDLIEDSGVVEAELEGELEESLAEEDSGLLEATDTDVAEDVEEAPVGGD